MKEKSIILLECLLAGLSVKKGEENYCLSDDYSLCMICEKYRDDKLIGECLVKVNFGDFTLQNFINWANTFSLEDITINSANKVLNEIKDKKMEPRLHVLVKEFFEILDVVEESDNGRNFSPVYISSCRCLTTKRLGEIFTEMKEIINYKE